MSNKTPANLSELTHRQLSAYALAATAAGVSVLALVHAASGKIIYTKTNVHVFDKLGYPLDLNNNGRADFRFYGHSLSTSDCAVGSSLGIAQARTGNLILGHKTGASALPAGVLVGSKASFASTLLMGRAWEPCGNTSFAGPWANSGKGVKQRYLGLKFKIKGKTHFGWARLNYPGGLGGGRDATMTGYAYETVPNKAIVTGKTKGPDDAVDTSLGQLARGAAAWRSK